MVLREQKVFVPRPSQTLLLGRTVTPPEVRGRAGPLRRGAAAVARPPEPGPRADAARGPVRRVARGPQLARVATATRKEASGHLHGLQALGPRTVLRLERKIRFCESIGCRF